MGLHETSVSLMQFTEAPLEEMIITNGTIEGPLWIDATKSVCNLIEKLVKYFKHKPRLAGADSSRFQRSLRQKYSRHHRTSIEPVI